MSKRPAITGAQAIKAFCELGFVVARISGSHHILKKEGHPYRLSVPVHADKTLKTGTLSGLLRNAGCTPDEFWEVLK
ncbi:MAG: type II toxin-antitoxin system HicA family toxin [Candidatus Nealsonbacteria bacterium]|nr:type II toxin-antitoxin system HicA family toxin [Candidatus Nealsonbacteria bacterium]